mmetsp:Transcript_2164/g.5050  ORF Transcript_2164/g.5050 Transcript_2164/m.5050 type:complete len:212 (-) Transcript_2164:163-798(-)|eukprot:CAMPEP_0178994050 /NCGR_PEP_ID=MMETSP0795-20121207/7058_1 /TAXON_ID=88552 /ORGANISM="Amoebophrya sp., Strain Ameob2" /LENGTH=211 /DNA_ID=CAMNT_0020686207 /DNA_START=165 /DNA_END=800 /DNA_ORIENTATION=-
MEQHQQSGGLADYYREKTQESLRRTLATLQQTDEIATKSCLKLDEQTEQIKRTQAYADTAENNLDLSEKLLQGMSSWYGRFKGAFSSAYESSEKFSASSARESSSANGNSSSKATPSSVGGATSSKPREPVTGGSGPVPRACDAGAAATTSSEDKDLALMSQLVGGLKEKSYAMGQTLSMHNDMLDNLSETTDRNTAKLERNQTRLKQVLR